MAPPGTNTRHPFSPHPGVMTMSGTYSGVLRGPARGVTDLLNAAPAIQNDGLATGRVAGRLTATIGRANGAERPKTESSMQRVAASVMKSEG